MSQDWLDSIVAGLHLRLMSCLLLVAKERLRPKIWRPCTEDAMIVFDASGSMAGSLAEGIGAKIRRIDEVRKALATALPRVTHFRKIGAHHLRAQVLTSNATSISTCVRPRMRPSRSWIRSIGSTRRGKLR